MMDHKITKHFDQPLKLLQHFLALKLEPKNKNLTDCQIENLSLLIQQIIVFLENWCGRIII